MGNTINLQLTVNDEELASLIKGSIRELPPEDIKAILSSAIINFLSTEEGKELFYYKSYYSSEAQPTSFLRNIINSVDISESITPTVRNVVDEFAANYQSILENMIKRAISDMLLDNITSTKIQAAWDSTTSNSDAIARIESKIGG